MRTRSERAQRGGPPRQVRVEPLPEEGRQATGEVGRRAGPWGPAEAGQEIRPRPGQGGSRAERHAAVDFLETPEQAAVSEQAEAGEVVGASVHLLHERGLGVDEATRLEDP